jgi:PST family polysaccharide transporter
MTIASAATNALAVWVACSWRPGLPARGVGVGSMLRFGSHVTGTNLVNYFSRRLDHILLGWWWGAVPLGLYTKAMTLMEAPTNRAVTPIGAVVMSSLSRVVDEPARYRDAYLRILEKLALALMPMAVFMIASADWLVPFLLGPRWVEAAPIFGAVAVLACLQPIERSHLWLLITQNRAHQALRWSLVAGLITALAVVLGLPQGALGVATALAISGFLRLPLVIWYVTRQGPMRGSDIYRTLATPALASACALLVLIGLTPQAEGLAPAVVLASGLAITAAVVLAILCALPTGRRALSDFRSSLQMLRRQTDRTPS